MGLGGYSVCTSQQLDQYCHAYPQTEYSHIPPTNHTDLQMGLCLAHYTGEKYNTFRSDEAYEWGQKWAQVSSYNKHIGDIILQLELIFIIPENESSKAPETSSWRK